MSEHERSAMKAIASLRLAATRGDLDAVTALVRLGNAVAGHLAALATHPEGSAGRIAADTVAGDSEHWPVIVSPIKRLDLPEPPKTFGSSLKIRVSGWKKSPDFDPNTRTGFALATYRSVRDEDPLRRAEIIMGREAFEEAFIALQPIPGEMPALTSASADAWESACFRWLESECSADWENFPWPDKLKADADARSASAGVGLTTAFEYCIREWLKSGLRNLVKPD